MASLQNVELWSNDRSFVLVPDYGKLSRAAEHVRAEPILAGWLIGAALIGALVAVRRPLTSRASARRPWP